MVDLDPDLLRRVARYVTEHPHPWPPTVAPLAEAEGMSLAQWVHTHTLGVVPPLADRTDPEPTERTAAKTAPHTRPLTRTDEAGFRVAVPREVGGLTILAVSRYHPGGTGFFASAIPVAEGDPGGFPTHQLLYDDDRDQWHVMVGHYLFASRDEADRDA